MIFLLVADQSSGNSTKFISIHVYYFSKEIIWPRVASFQGNLRDKSGIIPCHWGVFNNINPCVVIKALYNLGVNGKIVKLVENLLTKLRISSLLNYASRPWVYPYHEYSLIIALHSFQQSVCHNTLNVDILKLHHYFQKLQLINVCVNYIKFSKLLSVSSDLFGIIFPYLYAYIVHFIKGIFTAPVFPDLWKCRFIYSYLSDHSQCRVGWCLF